MLRPGVFRAGVQFYHTGEPGKVAGLRGSDRLVVRGIYRKVAPTLKHPTTMLRLSSQMTRGRRRDLPSKAGCNDVDCIQRCNQVTSRAGRIATTGDHKRPIAATPKLQLQRCCGSSPQVTSQCRRPTTMLRLIAAANWHGLDLVAVR